MGRCYAAQRLRRLGPRQPGRFEVLQVFGLRALMGLRVQGLIRSLGCRVWGLLRVPDAKFFNTKLSLDQIIREVLAVVSERLGEVKTWRV